MDHHKNLKSYLTLHSIDYADHGSLGFKAFSTYAPGKQNIIDIDLSSRRKGPKRGHAETNIYDVTIDSHKNHLWLSTERFPMTLDHIRTYLLYR